MKKIFRMALVFALAGATLMYTGCTKDYSEEINGLGSDVASLNSNLQALQQDLNTLKSSVSALESAYKAADAALQKAIDANSSDIAALKTAVDALKIQVAADETKIAANEAAIKKLEEASATHATKDELDAAKKELQEQITTLKNDLLAQGEAFQAALDLVKADVAANKAAIDKNAADILAANELILKNAEAILANAEDIKAAQAAIAANEENIAVNAKDIEALKADVAALQTKVADLEAAVAANKTAIEANAAEIEAIKAAYATKEELAALEENIQGAQDELNELFSLLSNELRSIVFLPDFYFAGIEATSFDIAEIYSYVPDTLKKEKKYEKNETIYKFPVGSKVAWAYDEDKDEAGHIIYPNDYTVSQIGIAKYDLNPSSFDVKNAKWSLVGMDRKYVVKGEESKVWAPVFEGISVEDGVASVKFSIENPDSLYAGVIGAFKEAGERMTPTYVADEKKENNVPVMKLVAELEEGKTVSSDWEAIVSGAEFLSHLAFAKGNLWVTEEAEDCGMNAPKVKDLYETAPDAALDTASVFVKYNGGDVDLAEFITIHANKEYTLAEWNAKYPGFSFNFEEVPYTIGGQKTSEDMYGELNGSVFTPCYVKSEDGEAESIAIEKDSEDKLGISAVGRMPIILVTLTDADGIVTTYGYFKIQITKDAPAPIEPEFYTVPSFGTIPFICSNVKMATTWHEFSYFVLETLGVDYEEFTKNYTYDGVWGYEAVLDKNDPKGEKTIEKFVKIAGEGSTAIEDAASFPKSKVPAYGAVKYTKDKTGNGINDAFSWNINPRKIGAGNSKSLYLRFNSATEIVYFELKADVADPAEITYGKINPSYWFNDVEEAQNTVRANVLVPQITDDDVTIFTKDIDDYFVGNELKVQLAEASDEIYAKYFDGKDDDDLVTTYTYKFAEEQPVINGRPLYVATNGKLRAAKWDTEKEAWAVDEDGNYIDGALIATISGTEITFTNETQAAKELLNLWGKEEKDPAKMLYANILVEYTAGDGENCVVAEGSDVFHVRFIRPLEIKKAAAKELQDAIPGGSVISLGYLINATDWNDNEPDALWQFVANTKKSTNSNDDVITAKADGFYADTYKTAAGEHIIWFNYYGITSIKVDAENIKTNQTGEFKLLSEVNKAAKAYLAQLNGTAFEEVAGGITGELSANTSNPYQIEGLTKYVFYYENNMGVVKDFKLSVPVEINYKWGTLKAEVEIPVKATYKEK